MSGLGQPLRAEIEVVAVERGEADTLAARIASPDSFAQAGVEYGASIASVRTALERRGSRYVVVLSTPQPVEEPFLDLLVELNWAAGRLVRQYTFLLDPAEYKGPQAITAPPSVAAPAKPAPAPVARPAEAPAAPATPAAPRSTPAPTAAAASGTYEVKQGDTLSKIAAQNKPEGVSLDQMLVALYRANESAFINKNMNLVRAGRTLTIPDRQAVEAIAGDEARRVVVAQAQDFNEYRARLGQAVAGAPARAEAPAQRAAGRIAAQPEAQAAAPAPAPKDELRVSKADDAAKGGKAAATARADDIAAREQALKDANERVSQLEKNVQDLQKLLELKNQQLADLQKQAQKPAAPAVPVVKPEAPKPAAEPAKEPEVAAAKPEAPRPAEAPKAAEPARPAEAPKPEAVVAAAPAQQPAPAVAPKPEAAEPAKPAAPEAVKPRTPPQPEASFVEELLDNPVALGGGGVALLALVGLGAYSYRKRRAAKLENSLLGATTTDSSSVFGTTGGRSVDTGGSSMQTDFSQGGIGTIDTDEVDPVAEADVYMAYGRDAQAEEILKEALQKDPSRQAVRLKLLEIYAARKDAKAFETTAGELYAATGGQGADWEKAAALGLSIDPTNPMYGGARAAAAAVPTGASQPVPSMATSQAAVLSAMGVGLGASAAPTPDLALDVATAGEAPTSIDFDLGTASVKPASADLPLDIVSQAPADLGFDLNLGGEEKAADEQSDFSPSGTFIMDAATKKAVTDLDAAKTLEPSTLSVDFELPGSTEAEQTSRMMAQSKGAKTIDFDFKLDEPQSGGGMDLSGISLDLGAPATTQPAPVDSHWQEVATKLDLAKAYEEMGDKDGARELLNEVLKEGDAAQQQQAKTMLAALA